MTSNAINFPLRMVSMVMVITCITVKTRKMLQYIKHNSNAAMKRAEYYSEYLNASRNFMLHMLNVSRVPMFYYSQF